MVRGARAAGAPSTRRRLPLVAHLLLLLVVLLVVVPFTRPGTSYTSDEGAGILEARNLERTGSWIVHDPLASVDPEGHARPVPRADAGTKGRAPYAKHPLYALVLAGADGVAGTAGLIAVSLVGTVLAAWAAGLIAERLRPGLGALTVWVVGLATPLFFDTYVVLAHTLAAATAGFTVLCALHAFTSRRARLAVYTAGTIALAVLTAALRTEGAFVGIGLALAAAVEGWRRRVPLRAAAAVACGALGAVAVVRLGERGFAHRVLGAGVPTFERSQTGGPWLAGRWHGLLATWFTPSYRHSGAGDFALIVGVIVLAVAAVLLRTRRASAQAIVVALALVAVAYVLRLVAPPGAIPGLVAAFPIGWAAAWLAERRQVSGAAAPLVVVGGFVAAAVLATQASIGGGVEWGGRYFAVALPVVTPFFVFVLAERAPDAVGTVARAAVVVAVVTTVALCGTAVKTLAHTHQETERLLDAISAGGREASPPGQGRPVVVSTERLLPQLAWSRYDRFRWLSPHEEDLATYGHRLASAGVDRLVLVSPDPATQIPRLSDYQEVGRPTVDGAAPPVPVIVLARR